jgi:hypothetical protein
MALLVQLGSRDPSRLLAIRRRGSGRHQEIASSAEKLSRASSSSPSLTRPSVLLVADLLRGPRRDCAGGSGPGVNGEGPGVGQWALHRATLALADRPPGPVSAVRLSRALPDGQVLHWLWAAHPKMVSHFSVPLT